MYGQQTLQDITFLILYGGVAVLALMAALYLLLRRANAIEPAVNPPLTLRRWTAAFLAAAAASHVWWFVLGYFWMTDDRLLRNITVILLDHATLVPLAMAVLLAMLQDRCRPLWPWFAVQTPVVAAAVMGIVWHDWFWGYTVAHYWQLTIVIAFVAYYVFALRQYGRWLRDNFADLEHKEVWQSLVFALALFVVYEMYTSNMGQLSREYLSQMLTVAIVGFFVWRVETLQRLASVAKNVDDSLPEPATFSDMDAGLQGVVTATAGTQEEDLPGAKGSAIPSNIGQLLKRTARRLGFT